METKKIKQICYNITDTKLWYDERTKNDVELLTLSDGLPGIMLLISELDAIFPNENWHERGNEFLKKIVELCTKEGLFNFSTFSGTAGVGFAINSVSQNGKYCNVLTKNINDLIIHQLDNYFEKTDTKDIGVVDYDVISGISGILPYMLLYKNDKTIRMYIEKSIDFLIELTKYKIVNNISVMRLFVRSEKQMTYEESKLVPNGAINTGLSHGIAGVGVALSMAYLEGIIREGHEFALDSLITFFENYKQDINGKIHWRTYITPNIIMNKENSEENFFFRDAWCYGAPGISIFYLYAGLAMNNEKYISIAKKTLLNSLNNIQGIYSPILCHGYSGLLEITRTFYKLTEDSIFIKFMDDLLIKIEEFYSDEHEFGFVNFEYKGNEKITEHKKGFLCGSTGIILTLLEGKYGMRTNWKRTLMLY